MATISAEVGARVNKLRLYHAARSLAQTRLHSHRPYATISSNAFIPAEEIPRLGVDAFSMSAPVQLDTTTAWPHWRKTKATDERCKQKLPRILEAMHSAPGITKTTISLGNILGLPLSPAKDKTALEPRTPTSILKSIGVQADCEDLALWVLREFPSIKVIDAAVRLPLANSRRMEHLFSIVPPFGYEASCTPSNEDLTFQNARKLIVERSQGFTALYQAFEYMAGFQARNLRSEETVRAAQSRDEFSVTFSRILAHNTKYLKRNPWQPNMYDEFLEKIKEEKRHLLCVMLFEPDMEDNLSYTVTWNSDVLLLAASDVVWKGLRKILKVGEDEDIVQDGKNIKKVKKVKRGGED